MNKLITLALILFVIWKFFLIHTMWQDRNLPPEPDDTLFYSGHIYSVIRCPHLTCAQPFISLANKDGYHFLSYRIFFGYLAVLLNLSAVEVFHLSFYIGTIALACVLGFFLTRLQTNPHLSAFSIVIIALYFGGGSYHGFFWVVPSFFVTLLLFLLLSLVQAKPSRYQFLALALTTASLTLTHPMGRFSLTIPLIWTLLHWLLTKTMPRNLLRNSISAIAIGLATFALASLALWYFSNPEQPQVISETATYQSLSFSATEPPRFFSQTADNRLDQFKLDYLNWLFPHPLTILLFLAFVAAIVHYQQRSLLSLYAATIIFSVTSTALHPSGNRSLAFLWPVTYLFYASGFWYVIKYLASTKTIRTLRRLLLVGTIATLIIFISVNIIYSVLFAHYINQRDNVSLNSDYIDYLLSHTTSSDPIFPLSKLVQGHLLNTELVTRPQNNQAGLARFYVLHKAPLLDAKLTSLDQFYAIATTFFRGPNDRLFPKLVNSRQSSPHPITNNKYITVEHEFNDIIIYRDERY